MDFQLKRTKGSRAVDIRHKWSQLHSCSNGPHKINGEILDKSPDMGVQSWEQSQKSSMGLLQGCEV